jgi:FAD/FMN-containing dehydrogenase
MTASRITIADPVGTLRAAVSADALRTDAATLALMSHDVHNRGPQPLAVLCPRDIAELSAGVAAAHRAGLAIVPRGGGMSYTRGYVPDAAGALVVDTAGMNSILSIDETDMTVTVEAGCTWAQLYEALKPRGLRVPVWGTLSGIRATVGGGMTQNGLFWGAGTGTLAHAALAFDVVLADGSILRTGNGFLRPYGPDVTGLFAADAGAFGIKAHVTLSLQREAKAFAYGSFAFETPGAILAGMSEVAREGLASESFAFDPFLQAQRMKRDSLTADAKALGRMMQAQGGFWRAIKEGAKVVAAGRTFLDDARFSAHLIAEDRTEAGAEGRMREIERIMVAAGGRIVENTIPKILRANPFPPVNSMVGPAGERWVPIHGIVRHSRAAETIARISALYEANAAEMERLSVGAGYMFLTIARTGLLIEPVFYFPGALDALHESALEPAHLSKLSRQEESAEARALVDELRHAVITIFGAVEGMHFQIGRTYPIKDHLDPAAWGTLDALKRHLDPTGTMNPGALGLGGGADT